MRLHTLRSQRIVILLTLCFFSLLQRTHATETKESPIIILGEDIFPPFEFIDNKGNPAGFFIDLTKEIFTRMNKKYILRFNDWKTIKKRLSEGDGDLILNVCYTKERTQKYAFTSTICYRYDAIVCKKEAPYRSLENLKDKKTVVIEEDISHQELKKAKITTQIHPITSINYGVELISQGKRDAFIIPSTSAEESIRLLGLKNLEIRSLTQAPRKMCIVSTPEKKSLIIAINKQLSEIQKDGTFQNIYNKWFGIYQRPNQISTKTRFLIMALAALTILFLLFIIILKKQVNKATELTKLLNKRLSLSLKVGNTTVWHYNNMSQRFTSLYGNVLPEFSISSKEIESYMFFKDLKKHHSQIQDILNDKTDSISSILRFKNPGNTKETIYIKNEMIAEYKKKKTVGIIGSWRNITKDIKLKEELFESNQMTLLALQYGNVVTWEYDCKNKSFTILYQKGHNEEYYKTIEEFVKNAHADYQEEMKSIYDIVTNARDERFASEIRYLMPNQKSWFYGTFVGVPFRKGDSSHITKFIGCSIDHTTLSKTLLELKEAKEKAERSDKLKSAFLANMSHEIRTPLNAIIGFSDLIISSPNNKNKSHYMKIITENNQLLLRLINDILDLSRIESGCLEFKDEAINLTELILELTLLYEKKMPQHVKLKQSYTPEACLIYMDKTRLFQIFTNFINNAIKFTSKGCITIGYTKTQESIRVFCQDTGIGITQENHTIIFDRFEKINSFTQGTGLGLAICKAIVENYQGKIGVDSTPQKGSIFWAEFSLQKLEKPIEHKSSQ